MPLAIVPVMHRCIVMADQRTTARAQSAANHSTFAAAGESANPRAARTPDHRTLPGSDAVVLIRILCHRRKRRRSHCEHQSR